MWDLIVFSSSHKVQHSTDPGMMASSRHSCSSTTLGVLLLHLIIAIITDTTTTMIDGVYSTSTNAATATSSLSFLSRKRLFGGMKRRPPPLQLHDDEYYTTAHHADAAATDNEEYNNHHHLHGVVVVEERPKQEEEEEYITNFYTRVRAKRRAMLNQDDTSSLPSFTSSSELLQYGSSSTIDEEKECDTTHNTAARSIRGGSSFWRNTRHQDTLVDADYYEEDSDEEEEEEDETVHHHHQQQQQHDHFLNHHCNGLLRVPCSIVINSESSIETASSLLDSPPSPAAVTAVSAYVDTGATVTVISAAAAKRAGIYHLMDSRYAGRATGVGHCRVLGRIPAHHVSFLLGGSVEKEIDDHHVKKNPRSVRGGGLNRYQSIDKKKCSSNNNNNSNGLVQMNGPALTVIEGSVTKGVDVLLGLDVLQDWEAVIRMSGPIQTITVREKTKTKSTRFNGDEISNTVVIPFATSTTNDGSSRRTSGHGMNKYSGGVYIARDDSEFFTHDHRLRCSNNDNNNGIEYDSDDNDDPYFSPTSTDIESDLDLLDKLGHEFPNQHVRTNPINNKQRNKVDDDIVNDDRDYYLHDDDDDEEKIDMSGL